MGLFLPRRSATVQDPNLLAALYPPLPQSVYDDFADDGVSTITIPSGHWYLPYTDQVYLNRSNVTVNWGGSVIHIDPSDGGDNLFVPIQVSSTPDTATKYTPGPGGGAATRYISKCTGTITTGTTTLTMDASEVVTLTPGDIVLIWAGVTTTDPVESAAFIPAEVASVNVGTRVVTFTAGLGKNITNYVNSAGLQAATDPDLWYKIGDWGTYQGADTNFSKGYGTTHGIERFVAPGFIHDITFNDLSLKLDTVVKADMPSGMFSVFVSGVQNFTINNTTAVNPHGQSIIHLWRVFNGLVDGVTITGTGSGLQTFGVDTYEGCGFTIWGGDGLVYRDLSIIGTDTTAFNVEVEAANIEVDGLYYDQTFTSAREYTSPPVILGFFSQATPPVLKNISLYAVTTGGEWHTYTSYAHLVSEEDFEIRGSSPTRPFDWQYQKNLDLDGTFTVGGVTYGPAITDTLDYTIVHGASVRTPSLPVGIYTAITLQVLTYGDLSAVTDSFGVDYWTDLASNAVFPLAADKWHQITPGDSNLLDYVSKVVRFYQHNAGSTSDATVRFQVTYLPVA